MAIEQIFSLRGATTVEEDTPEAITEAAVELLKTMIARNGLDRPEIAPVHLIAGTTPDLTSFYAVRAVRESGLLDAPVFSCLEPAVMGGLPRCIRFLLLLTNASLPAVRPRHVYLRGAGVLRPELLSREE